MCRQDYPSGIYECYGRKVKAGDSHGYTDGDNARRWSV